MFINLSHTNIKYEKITKKLKCLQKPNTGDAASSKNALYVNKIIRITDVALIPLTLNPNSNMNNMMYKIGTN
jgi:hypothetical protein